MANPDAQQQSILRRRQLAQALVGQSMSPMEQPQMPGVNASPYEGWAKILAGVFGGLQNRKLDKEQDALSSSQQADKLAQALTLAQGVTPQAQGDVIQPDNSGLPLPQLGAGPQQLQPAPQQEDARQKLVQALAGGLSSQDPMIAKAGEAQFNNYLTQGRDSQNFKQEMARLMASQQFAGQQGDLNRGVTKSEGEADRELAMQKLAASLIPEQRKPSLLTPEEEAQQMRLHPPTAPAQRNIDPLSPEGIAAAYERDKKLSQIPNRSSGGITPTAESNLIGKLSGQWDKASKDVQELYRANTIMDAGMKAARAGDMNAGSQAVLVTFQKFLDPASVVRESEYARSGQGQSMYDRVAGAMEKLSQGGAGMTLPELEKFAKMSQEIANNLNKESGSLLSAQKERIKRTADRYGVPIDTIIPDYNYANPGGSPAAQKPASGGGSLKLPDDIRAKIMGK